jgi:hypothetical protein
MKKYFFVMAAPKQAFSRDTDTKLPGNLPG